MRIASHLTDIKLFFSVLSPLLISLCGCGGDPEIRTYEAPKVAESKSTAAPHGQMPPGGMAGMGAGSPHGAVPSDQRMLAAIIPYGEQAWFFKVLGPNEDLEKHAGSFRKLMQSVRFEGDKPEWDAPETWQTEPGSGMRFATLILDSEQPELELSVIPLPIFGELDEYILSNVNRWRGQVGMAPITQAALAEESEAIELDGVKAILVDLKPAPAAASTEGAGAPAEAVAFKFEKPAGWQDGEKIVSRGGITLRHEAAFNISDGGQAAEVTVDRMPAMGGLKENLDRWRVQVGLAPMTAEQFKDDIASLDIGGQQGSYVELIGSDQSILGAVVAKGEMAWYFKLKGPTDLVESQKEAYRAFLDSVQF